MKIQPQRGYVLIISKTLTYMCGLATGNQKQAKGSALYPFLIVKSEEFCVPWLVNHERIHLAQQKELLIVPFFILSFLEFLYACVVLRKTSFEAYVWTSSEQEAYRHMYDDTYLERRSLWSQFKYFKDKKEIRFTGPGQIVVE